MADKDTFTTINDSIGGDVIIPHLLGRFVTNQERPTERSYPPIPDLTTNESTTIFAVGNQSKSLNRESASKMEVDDMAGGESKEISANSEEITCSIIITRILTNEYKTFQKLCEKRDTIYELRAMAGTGWGTRKLYFITGVRSIVTGLKGAVTKAKRSQKELKIHGKVPISEIASGLGIELPQTINPSGTYMNNVTEVFSSKTRMLGEICNNVQYQVVSIDNKYATLLGNDKTTPDRGVLDFLWHPTRKNTNRVLLDTYLPPYVVYNPPPTNRAIFDVIFVSCSTREGTGAWCTDEFSLKRKLRPQNKREWKALHFWPLLLPNHQGFGLEHIRISDFEYPLDTNHKISEAIESCAHDLKCDLSYHYSDLSDVGSPSEMV